MPFGSLVIGFIVLLVACFGLPARAAAEPLASVQRITVQATVAPARAIMVDAARPATIMAVFSNTPTDVEPTVWAGKVGTTTLPFTAALRAQYLQLLREHPHFAVGEIHETSTILAATVTATTTRHRPLALFETHAPVPKTRPHWLLAENKLADHRQ